MFKMRSFISKSSFLVCVAKFVPYAKLCHMYEMSVKYLYNAASVHIRISVLLLHWDIMY
jgi:hypothetical protein